MTDNKPTDSIEDVDKALSDGASTEKDAYADAPAWAQTLTEASQANRAAIEEIAARREAALEQLGQEMAARAKQNRERIEVLARETGVDTVEVSDRHPSKNGHVDFEEYDADWGKTLGLGR